MVPSAPKKTAHAEHIQDKSFVQKDYSDNTEEIKDPVSKRAKTFVIRFQQKLEEQFKPLVFVSHPKFKNLIVDDTEFDLAFAYDVNIEKRKFKIKAIFSGFRKRTSRD